MRCWPIWTQWGTKLANSQVKLSQAELAIGKINVNGMLCPVKVIEVD